MNEQEDLQAYDVLTAIYIAIYAVVDAATATLTPEQDDRVRTLLTENARFWRK